MAGSLADGRCLPCRGDTPPLDAHAVGALLEELPGWEIRDGSLVRTYTFSDFMAAVGFVNRVAPIAESEGHHPDLEIGWGRAKVTLITHAIDGLTKNDFIVAAKIDRGERPTAIDAES